ncbi:MAG: cell wall-binding repeat-containing protein [Clostridium argentinense]|uniref:cell wall-binding repeat-containing protein n=1 Tax=uncultured Clostridium sp. TaxID=59620 RepID=UPI001D5C38E8|nr:cell wall-binding repeat-containing protein [uncultured Clostridium sp.]MBS5824043.1 cell wall-binding repeat-containing protein [Clostridium argentinense]MDU1347691.1 cell wall-binding repeat-containing protein [Clostridium argentinense]
MKKNKRKNLLAILLISFFLLNNSLIVYGKSNTIFSVFSTEHKFNIKLENLKNINQISFKVSADYSIKENNKKLKANSKYTIKSKKSSFDLLEEGEILLENQNTITLISNNEKDYTTLVDKPFYGSIYGNLYFKDGNDDSMTIINEMSIDQYVRKVLPQMHIFSSINNLNKDISKEVIRAEAIVARTFAEANIKSGILNIFKDSDVTDLESGIFPYLIDENDKLTKVYDEMTRISKVQYLENNNEKLFKGGYLRDYYSLSNGGQTEELANVTGENVPYLKIEKDSYDAKVWKSSLNHDQLNDILTTKYKELNVKEFLQIDLNTIEKYSSGRIKSLNIKYKDLENNEKVLKLTGEEILKFLPHSLNGSFLSNYFDVTVNKSNNEDLYTFEGKGIGHGVGLSVEGAINRAKEGEEYKEILEFYYPDTKLIGDDYTYIDDEDDTDEGTEGGLGSGSEGGESEPITFKQRIGGKNRIDTSIEIAKKSYRDEIENLVITNGTDSSGIISSSVLAKKINAPILYTNKDYHKDPTSKDFFDFIKERVKKDAKIYVIGGDSLISDEFIAYLRENCSKNFKIMRLSGTDRFITNYHIVKEIYAKYNTPIVLTDGMGFADALSISPIAAENNWPIVFTNKDNINSQLLSYIESIKPSKIYIIGGEGAVPNTVINAIKTKLNYTDKDFERISGSNRYETCKNINIKFKSSPKEIVLTTGLNFADAGAGSIYAARRSAPLVLIDDKNLSNAEQYIKTIKNNISMTILGAEGVITEQMIDYILNIK